MENKKEKFNQSRYIRDYKKSHYIRREILLKQEELDSINKVLKSKNQTLKHYLLEHINSDLNKMK